MKSRWLFVIVMGFYCCVIPQNSVAGVGGWKNYTDMKRIRSIAADGETIWAATSGGVFRFDPADSTYQKFVNSDGLSTNDVTAITIDASHRLWIGHQTGNIDLYDPQTKQWRYISDISNSLNIHKTINRFYQHGDLLYIATAFGVTVFSISKFEFVDTFTSFGLTVSLPNVTAVRVYHNRVFLTTSAGIISSNAGAVNLADPASWTVALPAVTTANNLSEFNDTLYASSANGMLKYLNNTWSVTGGLISGVTIIATLDTSLLFIEGTSVRSLNTANIVSTVASSLPTTATSGAVTTGGRIFAGFPFDGIGAMDEHSQWQTYYPNGPYSNTFFQIIVDEKGELWSASGGHAAGSGFYRFDGSKWTNYTPSNTPLLLNYDCYAIALGPNNSKWISTWGEGVIVVNSDGVPVRRFDYSDPGLVGVVRTPGGPPSYTVPSRVAMDRSGNVWLAGVYSADRNKVLWKMRPDSTWESYPGSPFSADYAFMFGVVIDQNNTKWFTNALISRTESQTIVYYNEERSIGGVPGDWGTLTESDGVTNQRIQDIVVDREGNIWMGTGVGITIINEPLNPAQRITKVFDLSVRDLFINCIAVDPLNNKWIGTSRGVFVLSPDGTQSLHQYTVENTGGQLADNNILSIAIDGKKGVVYFGTDKGLSSLEIAAVTSKNSFTTIDLSPNPVYLPNHSSVEIRGLVDETTIKVLGLNGSVIRQFPSQGGGRAFWDCRDGEGRLVASGIYIIVAHNRAGDQVATAKVAVIQQ
ncbi:MAG: two-component regulator propeller domain-containing protein [Bacteroidota bacterium]